MVGITTATIIILLSGGGDVEHYLTDIKKNVKSHVDDTDRRKLILEERKQLSKDLKALGKEVDKHFEALFLAHAAYQSLESDFDAATARLVADQKQTARRMLDARDVMRAQTTEQEWEAIFKVTE